MDQFRPDHLINPNGSDVDVTRRRFLKTLVGAGALAVVGGCGRPEAPAPPPEMFAREPTWRQVFDGPLDRSQWRFKLGPDGGPNAGLQTYTDHAQNVAVRNGALVIIAQEETIRGNEFTSARIDTLGHQSFGLGRLVVRAKMPKGQGPHAAIWMRAVDGSKGEIDIVEYVGHRPNLAFTNVHTDESVASNANGLVRDRSGFQVPGATDNFIEYTVERTREGITFFINGMQAGESVPRPATSESPGAPFTGDMYLILNVAVGDNWAGDERVDRTTDPWQMAIDEMAFYPALAT